MKIETDYMKLVLLLDSELLHRMVNLGHSPLARDVDRAKAIKPILESIIGDKDCYKSSSIGLMQHFAGLFNPSFIKGILLGLNKGQRTRLKVERLDCVSFLANESEILCELRVLLDNVNAFLKEHDPCFMCEVEGGVA